MDQTISQLRAQTSLLPSHKSWQAGRAFLSFHSDVCQREGLPLPPSLFPSLCLQPLSWSLYRVLLSLISLELHVLVQQGHSWSTSPKLGKPQGRDANTYFEHHLQCDRRGQQNSVQISKRRSLLAGGKLLRKSCPRKCWACGGRQLPGSCQNNSLAPLSECICSKPDQRPLAA